MDTVRVDVKLTVSIEDIVQMLINARELENPGRVWRFVSADGTAVSICSEPVLDTSKKLKPNQVIFVRDSAEDEWEPVRFSSMVCNTVVDTSGVPWIFYKVIPR